jgi:hypothetical protein
MDTVPARPGWKTTEFWASLVFGAGGVGLIVWAARAGLRPGVDVAVISAGALLSAISFLGYVWSRASVKRAQHDANGNIVAAVASGRSKAI